MVALSNVALLLTAIAGAFAHVELTASEALPGSVLNTTFGVGHGCDGSNTVSITIQVPEQVTTIQPLDVAGWNLTLGHRTNNQSQISNFTWNGGNLDAHGYEAFGVIINVPDVDVSQQNVTLYFPAIQHCVNGTNEWVGLNASAAVKPAPKLIVTKQLTESASNSTAHGDHSTHGDHAAHGDDSSDAAPRVMMGLSAVMALALATAGFQMLI